MSEFHSSSHTGAGVTLALDAMGGDFGPESVIPGAAIVAEQESSLRFLFFGDERRIAPLLEKFPALKNLSLIVHTDKMIRNDEKPSAALRASKDSSMRMAIEAVEQGRADAVVSAGNTGALMAMAKMILKPTPGIHRPAIASVMPTMKSDSIMLDLGANVLVDAENLVQFAVLGAIFARAHKDIQTPTVGLLNVGSEETKGPDHVRKAAAILSKVEFPGRYYGFVEGDDITKGTVDVIVSDGYAGNIALKTAEGVGKLTGHMFKQAIMANPLTIISGMLGYFAWKNFKKKVDPRRYNGGVFLGLNGLCVKSHGGADAVGFSSALMLATRLARHGYTKRVAEDISKLMSQDTFLMMGEEQV